MDGNQSFDEYRMPDAMWDRIRPLLPKHDVSRSEGRPRKDLRRIADAIFYRMRTGCQRKAIPPELSPGSTAHQYFQDWVDDGVFDDLWQVALNEYNDLVGLDWPWQSVDGAMTKAPLGGEAVGKNPTDLVAKRNGTSSNRVPQSLAVGSLNGHTVGSIDFEQSWYDGRRRSRIMLPHYIWPARISNSVVPGFSDRYLIIALYTDFEPEF